MAEKKVASAKNKTAIIKLALSKHEKKDEVVIVNGKTYQIQRGVEVEVPYYVKSVLDNKEKMLRIAYDFDEEAQLRAEAKELK